MRCNNCGAEQKGNGFYCWKCGAPLAGQGAGGGQPVPGINQNRRPNMSVYTQNRMPGAHTGNPGAGNPGFKPLTYKTNQKPGGPSPAGTGRFFGNVNAGASAGPIMDLLGSQLVMAFCILITVKLLMSIFTDCHSFGGFLLRILYSSMTILTCVGVWLIYKDGVNKKTSEAGFKCINISLLISMSVSILVMLVIIWAVVTSIGHMNSAGVVLALLMISGSGMVVYYYKSLWSSSRCVCIAAQSGGSVPGIGLYVPIVMGLNIFSKVILLLFKIGAGSIFYYFYREMRNSYYYWNTSELFSLLGLDIDSILGLSGWYLLKDCITLGVLCVSMVIFVRLYRHSKA